MVWSGPVTFRLFGKKRFHSDGERYRKRYRLPTERRSRTRLLSAEVPAGLWAPPGPGHGAGCQEPDVGSSAPWVVGGFVSVVETVPFLRVQGQARSVLVVVSHTPTDLCGRDRRPAPSGDLTTAITRISAVAYEHHPATWSRTRAVEQFLAAKPLSPNARRSYAYCLRAVMSDLGADTSLRDVSTEGLRRVLNRRWGGAAAAAWNSWLGAVGPFRRWAET